MTRLETSPPPIPIFIEEGGKFIRVMPRLERKEVLKVLHKARMLDQRRRVVAFLEKALAQYCRQREADEASATPGQIKEYVERVEAAVAALKPKLDSKRFQAAIDKRDALLSVAENRRNISDKEGLERTAEKLRWAEEEVARMWSQMAAEQTIVRHIMPNFRFADLEDRLDGFVESLKALQETHQRSGDGSGPRLAHRRQLELAKQFWAAFEENGWLREKHPASAGSPMAQLLLVVLDSVGENRGTTALLEEARPDHLSS